jgi:hypothetical protein
MVPQVSDNGQLVAWEIGAGGDTLTSSYGVQIQVPPETFSDVTSVTLQPVEDNQVPLQAAIRLVPDSAFDVSFAQLNGRTTDLGDKKATVLVDLGERWTEGATIYELVNGQAVAVHGVSRDGTVLTFEISRPIRFVAGVPAASAVAGSRSLVPFIIIALISIILLIVAVSVLTSLRSRRTPTVVSRRTSGSRSRF